MHVSEEKKSREFYRGDTLVVWIHYDEDRLTFSGQDLGGYPGSSEYEYWLTVAVDDLRRVLSGRDNQDIGDLVCRHADAIMSIGEMTWLNNHGISYEFNSRIEMD